MSDSTQNEDSQDGWQEVAELSQLDPEFPLGVEVEGTKIGIFQCGDAVHALEDICPHAFALMSQGYVEDGVIECPLHGARFEIAGGKCLNEIGQRDLQTYPVRVVDGRIAIKLKG
jgi:nitrite reductase/ring-hydroxylating ferredoxin subunit